VQPRSSRNEPQAR